MAKEKFRYYTNRRKVVHRRAESWFASEANEKIYSESYTRVKGMDDLTPYESPKPQAKPKPKPKKGSKK